VPVAVPVAVVAAAAAAEVRPYDAPLWCAEHAPHAPLGP
jgi:hypothetical protein